uniref:PLD phosphodiesterase domain-containing protein n=1 Tax=Panagrellus redivivus TaxID=6233 RepID=A0A7E4UQ78_PANRE
MHLGLDIKADPKKAIAHSVMESTKILKSRNNDGKAVHADSTMHSRRLHQAANSFHWRMLQHLIVLAAIVAVFIFGSGSTVSKLSTEKALDIAKPQLHERDYDAKSCYKTCSIEIVESIPQNLTFNGFIPRTTTDAWLDLLNNAHSSISIAAYKSSLRGKHVFGNESQRYSSEGEAIYKAIKNAGINRKLSLRMVENGLSKDKGDNEDGKSLHKQGALVRRGLNMKKVFGSGTMHSKFIIADNRDFYVGSANLDWRSLNQKMELGVFVTNCPCLAGEMSTIFDSYWHGANVNNIDQFSEILRQQPPAMYNRHTPLIMQYAGVRTEVYLASSPKPIETPSRTWDLDAVVHEISRAKKFINVHVMDYIPMFVYAKQKRFWPVIDNALRAAILRGVDVKLLVAALHYPEISLKFIKSLELLTGTVNNATFEARVFKVPTSVDAQMVMRRERRTHNKFMVTENAVIIGTSNWSGDYFESKGTGIAIVIKQGTQEKQQPFVTTMQRIFIRDWDSAYTHSLNEYISECIEARTGSFCEAEKDRSLLAH